MDKVLEQINNGEFDFTSRPKIKKRFESYPRDPIKTDEKRKQQWYHIGKVVVAGHKVKLHKKSRLAAKRIYTYYKGKGNWIGPSSRQLGKMNQA